MAYRDFAYGSAHDAAANLPSATILSDDEGRRSRWCDDAALAGMAVRRSGPLGLAREQGFVAGDVLLVDCFDDNAASLAALSLLDQQAAGSGAALLVATSGAVLEPVFACLDQSRPTILVDAGEAECILAIGRIMSDRPRARLRDLSDDERVSLLRLTEQVALIAERLERLGQQGLGAGGGAFRFESPGQRFRGDSQSEAALLKRPKPSLPDARLVRRIIQQRQMRAKFFDDGLFADPAWDILLDLTAARVERRRVSVTSLCIASGVPSTTALRWIGQLIDAGLLERQQDEVDRRRAFIALTDRGAEAMAHYFAELGTDAAPPV